MSGASPSRAREAFTRKRLVLIPLQRTGRREPAVPARRRPPLIPISCRCIVPPRGAPVVTLTPRPRVPSLEQSLVAESLTPQQVVSLDRASTRYQSAKAVSRHRQARLCTIVSWLAAGSSTTARSPVHARPTPFMAPLRARDCASSPSRSADTRTHSCTRIPPDHQPPCDPRRARRPHRRPRLPRRRCPRRARTRRRAVPRGSMPNTP